MSPKFILLASLLFLARVTTGQTAGHTPVIFDSDMGPDYDDVGAITLLHAFADSGKIDILATIASDKYEGVAAVLNVFNTYFGRPGIPVGVPRGHAVDQRDSQHWTDTLIARYPHRIRRNAEAADAVDLYRKILSAADDRSVVIVTVGFLTNLQGLLRSGPDGYSALSGEDLVARKVKRLVSMAGRFPAGMEFNIFKDAGAARDVFSRWPGEVIFSGFEIGLPVKTGLPLVRNKSIAGSPVQDVFRIALPQAAEDSAGRSSWDETAVLTAVAGYRPWYALQPGRIRIAENGANEWENGNGKQFYLVAKRSPAEMAAVLDELMQHQPREKK